MSTDSRLQIQSALASFAEKPLREAATSALLSGRGGVLPTAAETPKAESDDFELVTWFVILAP